jgi:hypothetical protein
MKFNFLISSKLENISYREITFSNILKQHFYKTYRSSTNINIPQCWGKYYVCMYMYASSIVINKCNSATLVHLSIHSWMYCFPDKEDQKGSAHTMCLVSVFWTGWPCASHSLLLLAATNATTGKHLPSDHYHTASKHDALLWVRAPVLLAVWRVAMARARQQPELSCMTRLVLRYTQHQQ